MLSGWILLDPGDGGADIPMGSSKVGEHKHGFGLLAALQHKAGVGDGLYPVIKILQPVDKLGTRQ
jgi:hypothetical protein